MAESSQELIKGRKYPDANWPVHGTPTWPKTFVYTVYGEHD